MKKLICLLSLCFLCNSALGIELINGYKYVLPAEVKIGKTSTNRLYYFDQLTKAEQDIFLKNPKANTRYINGKLYFNMDAIENDIINRGYGIVLCSYENCRLEDKIDKENSSYTTFEEAGLIRDNNLHRYTIFDR